MRVADLGPDDEPFPPHWEFDVVLADGGTVHIRPILPSDRVPYLALFDRLSDETRYARFLSPKRELSDAEVEHFLRVDIRDRTALVAFAGEAMVAVARYDRLPDGEDAEVAFVIDDAHQGRGLGTLMLEYLAAAGRENGVTRFVAETLPGNRRMLAVFHDAGYQTVDHFADGVVQVEFPIAATDETRAVVEGREHRAEARSIERLLKPGSVAVIGASRRRGTIGHQLFLNLLAGGFEGPVHPVNRAADHVASVPAVASVLDVPGEVDLAVVAVPAESVPGVVEQCGEKGVKGLIVVSNGFRETGPEGARARAGGARDGPPVRDAPGRARTAWAWPTPPSGSTPRSRRRSCGPAGWRSSPSRGPSGIAVLEWTARLGIGISSFASIGNKADVSGNDLLQYWEDDPDTDVVLLYLESFGNPRKFARLARRVSARKPIVAVKAGRTTAGLRAATSHTAAVPSSDEAVTALFRQAGVIRVETLEELLDVTEVLASQPLPAGRRVAIVGNSGGPGILAADACVGAGLDVVTLSARTQAALRDLLGPRAAVDNPVDMIASATADDYERAIRLVLDDEAVDALIVIFTPPLASRAEEVAEAVGRAAEGAAQPVLANFLASAEVPAALAGGGAGRRIPTYPSPEPAAIALGRVATYAEWRRRDPGSVPAPDGLDRDRARALVVRALGGVPSGGDGRWLDDREAAALLACYGIPTPEPSPAPGAADPARPVVGAEGVETAVGLVQDPAFGPLVMVGMGGVATELLADRTFRILPITDRDAAEMVRSLRASPLLFGFRGAAPVAVDRLEELLVRVGLLADDLPEVLELDLNPVVVGEGDAVAVGARVRVGRVGPGAPELVRRLRA